MLRAKDWGTFQSYKDRSPPWIRLHKRLLDNYQFQKMSVEARALLPMLWLLVSEDSDPTSGLLRIGYEEIAFRLRQREEDVKSAIHEIIVAGFFEDESGKFTHIKTDSYKSVTEPSRNCHSETETETEKRQSKKEMLIPDGIILPSNWPSFVKFRKEIKKPITETQIEGIIKKANKLAGECKCTPEEILQEAIDNGWRGLFKISKGNENGTYQQGAGKSYARTQTEDEIWKGVI
jgi:hypothetical protein